MGLGFLIGGALFGCEVVLGLCVSHFEFGVFIKVPSDGMKVVLVINGTNFGGSRLKAQMKLRGSLK